MYKKDYYFDLPEELIAQTPIKNRDMSRLLILDKESGEIEHKNFKDIVDYLEEGDSLVLNNTRVLPARIFGNREGKEEKIEFLLVRNIEGDLWEVMVRPGKKARPGHIIFFGGDILKAEVLEITESGTRIVRFHYDGIFLEKLNYLGEMPLPPYIKAELEDSERYQTVYSKHIGSSAAPTAGLHFTEELLENLKNKGVNIVYITLHVGLGTFLPVKEEKIEDHKMHEEFYIVSEEAASTINKTREENKKVVCVGTTSARTLESVANKYGKIQADSAWTDIFIYPGYEFKAVDKLITNFHLPESTLLMLISALAGKEKIFKAYEEAIKEKYRFFSFGDSMLIK